MQVVIHLWWNEEVDDKIERLFNENSDLSFRTRITDDRIDRTITHCDDLIEIASQSAKNALRERDFTRHEKEVELIQQTAALEEQLRKYRGGTYSRHSFQ